SDSAQFVKGVGPFRYKLLNKLGIYTIFDLLTYFPFRYEDRSNIKPISELKIGEYETLKGKVLAMGLIRTKYKKRYLFEMAVADKSATIYAVWFNQPYMRKFFKVGDSVILYGKIEHYGRLMIVNPEYEIVEKEDSQTIHTGRIVPLYRLSADVRQRFLRSTIKRAIEQNIERLDDFIDSSIRERNRLVDLPFALKNIHFPQNLNQQKIARHRLVFDELFLLELILAIRKWKIKVEPKGITHNIDGPLIEKFKKSLPFELTEAQEKVINEIAKDMASDRVMNRLLQGEVGSGKTLACAYSMVVAVQSGYQTVLMCPTEILAEQHFYTLRELMKNLNIRMALITSSLSKKEKLLIKRTAEEGSVDIIVGTHSLIQENLEFKCLSLVVIDEQHKFGVVQRDVLRQKGINPDTLIVSATPIPRTLALTSYGDLDISIIDELPKGRGSVKTYLINEEERMRAYDLIKEKIKEGRQGYIIYPLVDESTSLDLKAAKKMYEKLKREIFSDLRVGLIHGELKREQRDSVMNEFKQHRLDLLVSTTVIEVGIDIPNATFMLIEHAERFGLSQLHQMRGRIARSSLDGICLVLSNLKTEESRERLWAFINTTDGFKIAEEDLRLRGPGEFFGIRQHGFPEFKLANLATDLELLNFARREAFQIIKNDPYLKSSPKLKRELIRRFGDAFTPLEKATDFNRRLSLLKADGGLMPPQAADRSPC
ncbi:MAG: ATP-dependent DNA helicase RecG, partial [Candidatus Omnitrophica bacterium]|nr:ATP-dependent DNA helicase RecG [Candidatus Omnitrophota bacterium]